ncbi:MAG TPA: phosphoribosyltransferase family protein [Cerasibacillus sp.]|uniref:phosphoribosyltransferase family protein n=1 Tax=Cerasibacillus sp. TaxID=2498711 RepID=UPI002F3E65FE
METYEITIAGITRQLPIVKVKEDLQIASFVILGDAEMTTAAAKLLSEQLPEVDLLVTAEAKGIPLVHELAKQLNMPRYIVARKSVKAYMQQPFISEVTSMTTQSKQLLCLGTDDVTHIKGKRIALIDDVISTGDSIRALEDLVEKAGGKITAKAAILAEGDAANRNDIIYLEKLPLF